MKVLHISKYYPPYTGGVEDVCYNIVNGVSTTHEQKVLCFNNENQTITSIVEGVEIRRVGIAFQLAKQPISMKYIHELKCLLNSFNPDIIHLHLPNPLICLYILLLNVRSAKIIAHWHSDIVAQKISYKLLYPIERLILKKTYRIIVTSPNYLECSKPLNIFREKCVVIPNMISLEKMNLVKSENSHSDPLQKKKSIVLFIGRHVEYKGIEYLLDAEKYITSDCLIYIAGYGPLTDYLKRRNESDRIHFIGRISDEDMVTYMNAASVFAFPSITKNEAFGVALAEAMYCKAVPVTFTIKGSGVNWVSLNGNTGIEVENKNSKAFGEAIDFLLKNDSIRMQYAEEGHKRVLKHFTMRTIKKQIIDIYESCL